MTSVINLPKKGSLEYNNELLVIHDEKNRKNQRWMMFSSAIWGFVTGPLFLLKEDWAWDNFMLGVWLFVTVSHLFLFVHYLRLSSQEVIMLDEIRTARVKTGIGTYTLVLKLRSGRQRKVPIASEDRQEMRAFVEANFPA